MSYEYFPTIVFMIAIMSMIIGLIVKYCLFEDHDDKLAMDPSVVLFIGIFVVVLIVFLTL